MANLTSFGITIALSASVANPTNSATFTIIAPWGQSHACASLGEAVAEVFLGKGGSPTSGRMGAYFSAQTLNGATSVSPPTPYTSANELTGA